LQKRLKYGLPTGKAIALYEIGFADRVIAQEIASELATDFSSKEEAEYQLQNNEILLETLLLGYPSYYRTVLDRVLM